MKVDVTKVGEFIFVTTIAFAIPAALLLMGLYLSNLFKFSELTPVLAVGIPFSLIYVNALNGSWVIESVILFIAMLAAGIALYSTVVGAVMVSCLFIAPFIIGHAIFYNAVFTKKETV